MAGALRSVAGGRRSVQALVERQSTNIHLDALRGEFSETIPDGGAITHPTQPAEKQRDNAWPSFLH